MSLIDRIAALEAEVEKAKSRTAEEAEQFRVAMLGRNGAVTELFEAFKQVAAEEKRLLGQRLNQLKQAAQARVDELKATAKQDAPEGPTSDLSAPASTEPTGSLHPITIVRQRIVEVFTRIGFTVSQGPGGGG